MIKLQNMVKSLERVLMRTDFSSEDDQLKNSIEINAIAELIFQIMLLIKD